MSRLFSKRKSAKKRRPVKAKSRPETLYDESYDEEYEEEYDEEYGEEYDDGYYDDEYDEDDEEYDVDEDFDDGYEEASSAPEEDGYYDEDEEYEEDLSFEDDREEYYDDGEDYDDEGDFEDEEDYYDDEEDFDDGSYEEDYEKPGVITRIGDWFADRSLTDYLIMGSGLVAAALIVVVCFLFFGNRLDSRRFEAMAGVGSQMDDLEIIGQSGLLAFADSRRSGIADVDEETEFLPEEEEEEKAPDYVVVMNLTSIQKDLKIKFVDNGTGRLISGVTFEVAISDPSGRSSTEKDTDQDGIIYLTGLSAGKYQVSMIGPDNSEYSFSKDAVTIDVKGTIEYKKVDVKDEIKKESEINAAKEDTQQKTETESQLTDTVEYVESTRTLIAGTEKTSTSYEAVSKDKVADPSKSAYLNMRLLSKKFAEPDTGEGNEGTPTDAPTPDPTSPPTDPPADPPTEPPTAQPTETSAPTSEPTATAQASATPTSNPTATAQASATPTTAPTATSGATATPTATASGTVSPSVTPTATATVNPEEKAKADTTSTLKTTSGETLYVKDGDSYREAKYADYYKFSTFYVLKKEITGEYRYTGWQTIDGYRYYFDKNGNPVTGEQVIQGAKYTFDGSGRIGTGSGVLGIDVSKWNGSIDWGSVRNSGVSFVIIRCGYRGSATGALVEDPTFRANIRGAQNAGLKVGIYFFSQAVNEVEAVEEASMVLSLIGGYNISYPVYLDVEGSGGRGDTVSVDTRTQVCQAFCKTIQNSGYKAGVYANKTWFNSYINTPSLTGYKLWLAQYAAAPTYSRTRYDMWQYSSGGSVSGISGRVDMNISYLGY